MKNQSLLSFFNKPKTDAKTSNFDKKEIENEPASKINDKIDEIVEIVTKTLENNENSLNADTIANDNRQVTKEEEEALELNDKPTKEKKKRSRKKKAKVEETPTEIIKNCANDKEDLCIETTPNKNKRLKRKEKDDENMKSSTKTNNETPDDKKKSPAKSEGTINTNTAEEEKEVALNSKDGNAVSQDENGKSRRKRKGRKPKNYMEEQEENESKKREKKMEQKSEKVVVIPEEVQNEKTSISIYQDNLNDLIKAGIDSKLNFDNSIAKSHLENCNLLSEFISSHEEIDLKAAETQIIFVKTLSPMIDGSSLPLSQLVQDCESKLKNIHESCGTKILSQDLEEFIKINAERKVYGNPQECSDVLNDTSPEALYCWEIVNTSLMDGIVLKDVNLMRTSRTLISDKIKIIAKIIALIDNATKLKHLEKIESEKEKLVKAERKETSHAQKVFQRLQQIEEKEHKEMERLERKRLAELEKDQKENERKHEIEAKKKLEQDEKERKKQEALLIKKEQEEAKKRQQEELKRQKEEAAKIKEDAIRKKKEELLKAQKDKENSQQKLLTFFKKASCNSESSKSCEENKKNNTDVLDRITEERCSVADLLKSFESFRKTLKIQH